MNTPNGTFHYTISAEDLLLKRLDKILAQKFPTLSRTYLQALFEDGNISTESAVELSINKVPPVGTKIIIDFPVPLNYELTPENIPLDILFEDEDIIIINKPAGMCVHPAAGNWEHTLVHALLFHCPNLKGIGNVKRPGIVHRLDIGTTGVMIVAKSQLAHNELSKIFKEHELTREYELLILKKNLPKQGIITGHISRSTNDRKKMTSMNKDGKHAVTKYNVLKESNFLSHVQCKLETGRTHQIRVHFAEKLKAPLLNDYVYGNPKQQISKLPEEVQNILQDYKYPLLHAKRLSLLHPLSKKQLDFSCSFPSPFKDLVELMNSNKL